MPEFSLIFCNWFGVKYWLFWVNYCVWAKFASFKFKLKHSKLPFSFFISTICGVSECFMLRCSCIVLPPPPLLVVPRLLRPALFTPGWKRLLFWYSISELSWFRVKWLLFFTEPLWLTAVNVCLTPWLSGDELRETVPFEWTSRTRSGCACWANSLNCWFCIFYSRCSILSWRL